jgi:hypothetical protein
MSSKKKVVKKSAKKPVKKVAAKRSHKKKPTSTKTQSNSTSYIFSDTSLTVSFPLETDGKVQYETRTFDKSSSEYNLIKAAILGGRFGDIPKLASAQIAVKEYVKTFKEKFITAEGNVIKIDGSAVPSELADRIMVYAKEGLPYMDLVNFFRNLNKNPSNRAVQGLFRFLDKNHFPLTPDGCFIGYKGITSDFKDLHTRTFDNSIGSVVKVDRNKVCEDPEIPCAAGLHVGSFSLVSTSYGGEIKVEVLVNPKDVVSVPFADDAEKMRVCEYKVIGISNVERTEQRVDTGYRDPPYVDLDEDEDEDDDDDDDNEDEYNSVY